MRNMDLLEVLVWSLTFYVHVGLSTRLCQKGQKVSRNGHCEDCPDGYFQPEEVFTRGCIACTKCDKSSGSVMIQKCTKETNTKCQCRTGFVQVERDYATCKCDIGFGLKEGECLKCEHGYFSSRRDSPCQEWKKCKSGVKELGTFISDAICNQEMDEPITTPPTSNKNVSVITRLRPQLPHEGAETHEKPLSGTTSSTPAALTHTTTKDKVMPQKNPNHTGVILLIVGIIGVLVLIAVMCRLISSTCEKGKAEVQSSDSCRRPVEESGDSSLTSLKLNPEEP